MALQQLPSCFAHSFFSEEFWDKIRAFHIAANRGETILKKETKPATLESNGALSPGNISRNRRHLQTQTWQLCYISNCFSMTQI